MTERTDLLVSIANTIRDYREGEIEKRTPDHVGKWIVQFDRDAQMPMLREVDHVLKQTYLSKDFVSRFFATQIRHPTLVGNDPKAFWQSANLLTIQQQGQSQRNLAELFRASLKSELGITTSDKVVDGGTFIYMDDILFGGSRIGNDLKPWIQETAPKNGSIHVLVIASHAFGKWRCFSGIKETISRTGKIISVTPWDAKVIENRFRYRDASEVLWPALIPNDQRLGAYMRQETKYPFQARNLVANSKQTVFSSETGRQLLEQELLLAGIKIRANCVNPKSSMRPLGYSGFGLGFGATVMTYQNCPNNCPLALWWGDPEATSGPFHWYPLLPRRTYAAASPFEFEALD